MGTYAGDLQTLSLGLLVARVVIGFLMAAHGTQKLVSWFGGHGLRGTAQFFEQFGFRPGIAFAAAASIGEIVSGLFASKGIELPLLYAAAAFAFALTGFGQYSLDNWLGIAGHLPITDTWIALLVGTLGGFANVALRRRPAVAQA
jgi:putative oxidoreductase